MFQKYKKELIFSSLFTLLPILIGLLIWDQLPDVMATHWGVNNQADSYSSKEFAVFVLPCILLGIHWLCLWITHKDPGHQNQNKKAFGMIFWMVPLVSLFTTSIMYGIALGNTVNMSSVMFAMMGLMLMGIGNYLPKTKQNFTLGIKIIWTLNSEENWNATHRFAGKLWFFGGLLLVLTACFPAEYGFFVLVPTMFAIALVPMVYSYLYYKKQCREGRGYPLTRGYINHTSKTVYRISMVALVLILILVFIILFTGSISCVYHADSFTVEATFHDDLTVEYDVIDSVEIRYAPIPGRREFGFGSAKLQLGTFRNEEFGLYSRYTYTNCECAVIITAGEKTLVLAGATVEDTEAIYEVLLAKTGLGE